MSESSLCVALTGATGFVGRSVLRRALGAGHRVRALLRDPDQLQDRGTQVVEIKGDLFHHDALAELVNGADAVIHLVGIIDEKPDLGQTFERVHVTGAKNLLAAATAASTTVKRWVHMSALGTRPDAVSNYHLTKWRAEQAVRASGLDWTIFRPSIIHGPDGEFMRDLVTPFCRKLFPPFMPYFGAGLLGRGGGGKVQPVWVEDVARCFVDALTNDKTIGETYPLGGPDRYTFPQLYTTCQQHLPGAQMWKKPLAIPAWKAKMLSHMPGAPFNWDQVVMSQEDSICDNTKAQQHFGFELAAFEPTFKEYAARIE